MLAQLKLNKFEDITYQLDWISTPPAILAGNAWCKTCQICTAFLPMPATVDTDNLCRSQFLLFLFWNCCFMNLFGLQKIILSCNINYKGLRILTIIRQVLIEQRCFLVPGPPNLALSLQLQHWPQSSFKQP